MEVAKKFRSDYEKGTGHGTMILTSVETQDAWSWARSSPDLQTLKENVQLLYASLDSFSTEFFTGEGKDIRLAFDKDVVGLESKLNSMMKTMRPLLENVKMQTKVIVNMQAGRLRAKRAKPQSDGTGGKRAKAKAKAATSPEVAQP